MPASSNNSRLRLGNHVCHFTVVHDANDVRILERQIRTLITADFVVTYIARGQLKRSVERCHHHQLKVTGASAMSRLRSQLRGWRLAMRSGARTMVLHDPELLPIGILLQLGPFGRRVIFDCHEDYSTKLREKAKKQLLGRAMSYAFLFLAFVFGAAGGHFLAPTEHIRAKLGTQRTTLISNLPTPELSRNILQALKSRSRGLDYHRPYTEVRFAYTGMISLERNLSSWVPLVDKTLGLRSRVVLAGPCAINANRWLDEVTTTGVVTYLGNLSVQALSTVLAQADVGVVVLPNVSTYQLAKPTKLFEYLLSGLPVVLSDFEEWRKIVDMSGGVGFYCDPSNASSVASTLVAAARYASQESYRERLERATRAAAVFSWEHDALAYVRLMRSSLSSR